jgi:hypothetical protein
VLVEQADIFYRVSKQFALAVSLRDQKKLERDEAIAQADDYLRRKADTAGTKVTEEGLKKAIQLDKEVSELLREVISLNTQVERWSALKEAFIQRSYAVKDMVALYSAGYWTTASMAATGNDSMNARADRLREKAGELRRERRNPE